VREKLKSPIRTNEGREQEIRARSGCYHCGGEESKPFAIVGGKRARKGKMMRGKGPYQKQTIRGRT